MSSKKLLIYEKFKTHRKHCRMKFYIFLHLFLYLFIQSSLIYKLNAQSIIKQTTNVQQTSLNTKSSLASSIKNAYTGKCARSFFKSKFLIS